MFNPLDALGALGLKNVGQVYYNLSVPQLVEHAIAHKEAKLAANGALCVKTGHYTGRSPRDRFIVDEPSIHDQVDWNAVNVPISKAAFNQLYQQIRAYVQGRDLYMFDGFAGADPEYRVGVRVINELASQNLFVHQMFLRPTPEELKLHQPEITVIAMPGLHGDPELTPGIRSEAFIVMDIEQRLVIIGGSKYAGEIKKSVFSMMNFFLTERGVLPMHSSANVDDEGHTALFFGLSGTGKTTLSADPNRRLIGDDEHGWSPNGIFNFEGGCYAKTIRLSPETEPQIWDAIRFGALMENVVLDPHTRQPDYNDGSLTENTRAAYPLHYIPNAVIPSVGRHPKVIIFLTADAFGVLPPIAKLTKRQAMYHFISGYTSKLAGTERGITEPQAVFSACFGKPFMPRSPAVYARMLGDRISEHNATVYLINTGWSGGAYGVGHRIPLAYTRAMVTAALTGALDHVPCHPHPIFRVLIPEQVPGVPTRLLNPHQTWVSATAYEQQAHALAEQFIDNFKQFEADAPELIAAQPDPTGLSMLEPAIAVPLT
ncbi:MAG: phosphoenolpyruvate carboxykinase (ATP) [Thainema sp.]